MVRGRLGEPSKYLSRFPAGRAKLRPPIRRRYRRASFMFGKWRIARIARWPLRIRKSTRPISTPIYTKRRGPLLILTAGRPVQNGSAIAINRDRCRLIPRDFPDRGFARFRLLGVISADLCQDFPRFGGFSAVSLFRFSTVLLPPLAESAIGDLPYRLLAVANLRQKARKRSPWRRFNRPSICRDIIAEGVGPHGGAPRYRIWCRN